jgi:hypothetical protein
VIESAVIGVDEVAEKRMDGDVEGPADFGVVEAEAAGGVTRVVGIDSELDVAADYVIDAAEVAEVGDQREVGVRLSGSLKAWAKAWIERSRLRVQHCEWYRLKVSDHLRASSRRSTYSPNYARHPFHICTSARVSYEEDERAYPIVSSPFEGSSSLGLASLYLSYFSINSVKYVAFLAERMNLCFRSSLAVGRWESA